MKLDNGWFLNASPCPTMLEHGNNQGIEIMGICIALIIKKDGGFLILI